MSPSTPKVVILPVQHVNFHLSLRHKIPVYVSVSLIHSIFSLHLKYTVLR